MDTLIPAPQHPVSLFKEWFAEIEHTATKQPMAAAVCLATASKGSVPSSRMVLLKKYDEEGFVIYTNMESRKGKEIRENPQAALCFYWPHSGRQVRVEGCVMEVSSEEADAYFHSRPLESRIGAWASMQSRPMEHTHDLVKRVAKYTAIWAATGQIDRPPYWTGVRVVPDYFEFLQESSEDITDHRKFILKDNNQWHEEMIIPR